MKNIDVSLQKYIENTIIPQYNNLDLAHKPSHVYDVIKSSFIIAKDYTVDLEMVYVIAAFHDIGLLVDRKTHHFIGGKMLYEDLNLRKYFNDEQLLIMKEAVEDHRASTSNKPRSIYGLIISEADLFDTAEVIIERTVLYRINNDKLNNFDIIYSDSKFHLEDKYGVNGYLVSWLNSNRVSNMLKELRNYLNNDELLKEYCYKVYLENKKEL